MPGTSWTTPQRRWQRCWSEPQHPIAKDLKVFMLYEVEELDKALDRVNTVHVAFLKNDMAKMVYNDLNKLDKFLNS